jgi:hypothetical protein
MLRDAEPAHPNLIVIGFGCSVASTAWLLLPSQGFRLDPLLLVGVAGVAAVAGWMLLYALSRRVVAAATLLLVLGCHAAIHVRVEHGTWSGLPVLLVPITVLAIMAWLPRSSGLRRRECPRPEQTRVLPRPTSSRPIQVMGLLGGRWAVLGGKPLPDADRGGQSRVHLALDTWHGGRKVVAKLPSRDDSWGGSVSLAMEAELLLECRGSRYVVRLLDSGFDVASGTSFIILAHHARGSLARFLDTTSGFPLGSVLAVGECVLRGLVELHEHRRQPIAHGDLNPRNLLLREDGFERRRPAVVICDFGTARRVSKATDDELFTTSLAYSPWYAAPEILQSSSWGLEADVYGMGSVLYELVTGWPPLRRESARLGKSFAALLRDGERPASTGACNSDLPPDLVELIDSCLAPRPDERPGPASEVLSWLRQAGRGVQDLPIQFTTLRGWDGPTGIRSA